MSIPEFVRCKQNQEAVLTETEPGTVSQSIIEDVLGTFCERNCRVECQARKLRPNTIAYEVKSMLRDAMEKVNVPEIS
jgi:hypothetical protein